MEAPYSIPQKFINFAWRCARSILPVRTALLNRGINIDITCPLCLSEPESPLHLFVNCQKTKILWVDHFAVNMPSTITSFEEGLLSDIMAAGNIDMKCRCVAMCWSIWTCRNELVWSNKPWDPRNVLRLANSLLDEWNGYTLHGEHNITCPGIV